MTLMSTPICQFGLAASDFSLKNVLDDELWNLARVQGECGTLIMFICNHCPYVQAIIQALVADIQQLQAEGIGVAAIMSNDVSTYPADSPQHMKLFAQKYNFSFPYLWDDSQTVAQAYEAVCTPDFFAYNADLELQYRGRFSASGQDEPQQEADHELLIAMRQIAATGQGPETQIASMGCSIKWRDK